MIELTGIAKTGGPLTKRISLAPDGTLLSDGSACTMASGRGWRTTCATMEEFAAGISALTSDQAIALGALRSGLPDEVTVVTKAYLEKLNGTANDLIARTSDHIHYRAGQPALALIDIDTKGMPPAVRDRIKEAGGFWAALVSVVPELAATARVLRPSTSTGISNADTGEQLLGSNGWHIYPLAQDGADVERFLRTLHDRCWLAGFGWYMAGAAGQLLERSIVDRMVFAPERLVFEGAPVLDPPLVQDLESRKAVAHDGEALDTIAACPPLTVVEKAALRDLRDKDAHRLAPDQAKTRGRFITEQAARIAARTGCTVEAARRTVERQCDGILLPDVVLPFDDAALAGCTVADVLADPERFVDATLADPLEGVEYGRCKALIMRRAGGTPWIHSFAHGRTTYELQHDASAIEAILLNTPDEQLVRTFVRLVVAGDLAPDEQQLLRDRVAKRSGINKRTIGQSIDKARKERDAKQRQARASQQAAQRRDPRPRIKVPPGDDPWLPQMAVLNEVHSASQAGEPPERDVEGERARLKMRTIPRLHLLSTETTNPDQEPEGEPQNG